MANTETQHLVSMANDIAANLSFRDNADAQIADHIKRFWAPRMRKLLLEYVVNDDRGLSVELLSALKILRQA
jgi:formate dehydrogenase subunit delta